MAAVITNKISVKEKRSESDRKIKADDITMDHIFNPKHSERPHHKRLKSSYAKYALSEKSAENVEFIDTFYKIEFAIQNGTKEEDKAIQEKLRSLYEQFISKEAEERLNISPDTMTAVLEDVRLGKFRLESFRPILDEVKLLSKNCTLHGFKQYSSFCNRDLKKAQIRQEGDRKKTDTDSSPEVSKIKEEIDIIHKIQITVRDFLFRNRQYEGHKRTGCCKFLKLDLNKIYINLQNLDKSLSGLIIESEQTNGDIVKDDIHFIVSKFLVAHKKLVGSYEKEMTLYLQEQLDNLKPGIARKP